MTLSIHIAGWTLVHFVWQGAIVGLVAAVALRVLCFASAQTRYAVACGALAAMLAAPIITARLLTVSDLARAPIDRVLPAPARVTASRAPAPFVVAAASRYDVSIQAARVGVDTVLPLLVTAWFAGVALLLLRLGGGWWRVRRLHLDALALAASSWQSMSDRLASRLGVRCRVHVVDSPRVDTPTVLGWLRPAILLPIAALANLAPAQVEAILAHELAHIRRHDYVVNLLQTLTETLLFYHPAVWWVSSRIRAERENCCDDVAVNMCGDAIVYAVALTELETWRTTGTALTLAATDGSLLVRVRRVLLGRVSEDGRSSAATVTVTLALLLVMLVGGWPQLSARIPSANSQTPEPANTRLTFEAASVKPSASGPTGVQRGGVFPGERVTIVNEPLRTIIQMAYQVNVPQIIGAPGWTANERFDITAKAETPSSADQLRAMLQSLLADRFKLAAHRETRNSPVYALVIARSDGRLGPQLHPEAQDCESLRVIARAQPGAPDPCRSASNGGPGRLSAKSKQIDLLASLLQLDVNRPVVNKTGLTGSYDWDLTWTLQRFLQGTFDHDQFPTVDPNGPTIYTAVQEQLGLKLEPMTGADTVLVIDHVERPTAD